MNKILTAEEEKEYIKRLKYEKTIFNDIQLQTQCQICGSKLSGQYVIGDDIIYLICVNCENNKRPNGFFYKMISNIEDYKNRLEYLQIIDPNKV